MSSGIKATSTSNLKKWRGIVSTVTKCDNLRVRTGIFKPRLAARARNHEFGTRSIPERSIFRSTFHVRRQDLERVFAVISNGMATGKISERVAMQTLGKWCVATLQEQIIHIGPLIWRPLAPETIRKKKGPGMLIETGEMLGAIDYKVGPR